MAFVEDVKAVNESWRQCGKSEFRRAVGLWADLFRAGVREDDGSATAQVYQTLSDNMRRYEDWWNEHDYAPEAMPEK